MSTSQFLQVITYQRNKRKRRILLTTDENRTEPKDSKVKFKFINQCQTDNVKAKYKKKTTKRPTIVNKIQHKTLVTARVARTFLNTRVSTGAP